MNATARAALVMGVVVVATFGEGGASAPSLLAQHLILAAAVVAAVVWPGDTSSVPRRGPATAWLGFAGAVAVGALFVPYAYAAWLVLVEIAAFGVLGLAGVRRARSLGAGPALGRRRPRGRSRPCRGGAKGRRGPASRVHVSEPQPSGGLAGRRRDRPDVGRRRPPRIAGGACGGAVGIAAALAGIFVSGSRGALLGLAAGAAVLVALAWAELSTKARRQWMAGAALLVLAAGAGVAARFRVDDDPYRFHRTRIWPAALRAVAESPWRGTGPGQFAVAAANLNFPNDATPLRYERAFGTPHSDLVRAFSEFGFPAGLLALAAGGLLASAALRRRAALTPLERGAFAALAALAAQGLVDDLSTRPAIVALAAACCGLLLASPREAASPRYAGWAAAVLLAGMLGAGEIAGYLSWSAIHELPPGRLDGARLASLRRSIAWNPMQPAGFERLASHDAEDGRSWTFTGYASAREAAEHARRLQPADAFYARALARIEANACLSLLPFTAARERAARLYEQAHMLSRYDASIPLEEAKFLMQTGDLPGARLAAEHALRIEPNAAVPRLWLARARLELEGGAAADRARTLLDEAERLALPRGRDRPRPTMRRCGRSILRWSARFARCSRGRGDEADSPPKHGKRSRAASAADCSAPSVWWPPAPPRRAWPQH
jgi:tetratricopeptide (TPR) repeat protein